MVLVVVPVVYYPVVMVYLLEKGVPVVCLPVLVELWVLLQAVPVVYFPVAMVDQVDQVCFYLAVPVVHSILKNRN